MVLRKVDLNGNEDGLEKGLSWSSRRFQMVVNIVHDGLSEKDGDDSEDDFEDALETRSWS